MTTPAGGSPPGRGHGVRSFDELMARQADAAIALSGAHHSSWRRGQLGPTRKVDRGIVLGTADWDGTLRYDHGEVVKPLREMFARQGRQLAAEDLVRYRSALLVVLHENTHMLAPEGRDNGDREDRDTPLSPDAARMALEEGATEAWAYRNLDRYIDELGLEDVAPGLNSVTAISRYQHYLPAADILAERIGERSGAGRDELLRQLNCELSDRKWRVVTEHLYQSSNLPELVPPGDVRRVRGELNQAMRAAFSSLTDLETMMPVRSRATQSAALGEAAYYEGLRAVARIEERYRSGTPVQQDRQAEQGTQPQGQPEQKDALDVALSGTVSAGRATATRPGQAKLNKAPANPQRQNGGAREPGQADR
ncbi:hypothetical protein [Kribbella sp.]|uniref:hypothetical protein n=1 Tax=Kribbella sp. TaxID=1871183 RepID=UPI002D54B272|nr:hypothetical protein [Kribbella sp.]HZX05261.1 hypothetical protein [Kribbella sp.]